MMPVDLSPANRAFVSCVIPFLNAERYLGEAIESVLAQTYEDWELLLVDDGSSDRSREIAERYRCRRPDRIRVLQHENGGNRGKSVSRNLAVRASRGDLIAFLDADDVWLPGKLDAQVRILREQTRAAATYSPVRYWYSWTGRPRDRHRDRVSLVGFEPDVLVRPPEGLIRLLKVETRRAETISPYPSAFVVRRSAFDEVGGFEDDFERLYDDVIFFAKILAGRSVFISGEPLALYRLRADEQHSASFLEGLENGHWLPGAPNQAEAAFLARLREHLSRQGLLRGRLALAVKAAELPYQTSALAAALAKARAASKAVRRLVAPARRLFRTTAAVPPGRVRWGDFGAAPIGRANSIGGRGGAITDALFARFACDRAANLQGDVAEVGDDALARRICSPTGRATSIIPYDALERPEPDASLRSSCACLIAHDVLRFSRDPGRMLDALASYLKPGGVLLTSMTSVAPVLPGSDDRWRFTLAGAHALFETCEPLELLEAKDVGGIKMSIAVMNHLGWRDLNEGEIESPAQLYPVQIMIQARKR